MKTLTQHIEESLNKKSIKEVSKDKTIDEDSASFRRASPAKGGGIAKGTISNEKREEK